MSRLLFTLLLLFAFSSSVLGCGLAQAFGSGETLCSLNSDLGCKIASKTTEDDHKSSSEEHHCHLNCLHTSLVLTKPIDIKAYIVSSSMFARYIFIYSSPTMDSLERPPLAA